MKLSAPNVAILKNMSDLMTRELWGAYEDSYKQRILQLKKACPGAPIARILCNRMPILNNARVLVTLP